jgi:hypothetical protein
MSFECVRFYSACSSCCEAGIEFSTDGRVGQGELFLKISRRLVGAAKHADEWALRFESKRWRQRGRGFICFRRVPKDRQSMTACQKRADEISPGLCGLGNDRPQIQGSSALAQKTESIDACGCSEMHERGFVGQRDFAQDAEAIHTKRCDIELPDSGEMFERDWPDAFLFKGRRRTRFVPFPSRQHSFRLKIETPIERAPQRRGVELGALDVTAIEILQRMFEQALPNSMSSQARIDEHHSHPADRAIDGCRDSAGRFPLPKREETSFGFPKQQSLPILDGLIPTFRCPELISERKVAARHVPDRKLIQHLLD